MTTAVGGLRVLLVTKGLDLGGIERVVTDLAIRLRAAGVDVEVAVVNSSRDRLAVIVEQAGVPLHRLDGTDVIGVRATQRLARLIRSGRHDIVHVHGPLPSVVARIAALPIARRPRVVTTSHTPWPSLRLLTRLTWRATARADSAVVAVSTEVAASLPALARRRAIVVPHGIDPDGISRAMCDAAVAAHDSSEPTTVISVASHRDAKNYPNLLHAVKVAIERGSDLRLHAIGDGRNLENHRRLAISLGLDDVVTFAPSTDDVLREIARADMLVVASDYEGQPIVVAEALALGVPVVATAVGRVPELVNRDVGRVVAPGDPVALGAALAELAAAPELRASMSVTARQQRNAWTLDDVVAAHLDLYRAVVGGHLAEPLRRHLRFADEPGVPHVDHAAGVEHGRSAADHGVAADLDGRTFARATGVLWRLVPGRVLLHRIGVGPEQAVLELSGVVAFVWIALDRPGTVDDVSERLADSQTGLGATDEPGDDTSTVIENALQMLVDAGVVEDARVS